MSLSRTTLCLAFALLSLVRQEQMDLPVDATMVPAEVAVAKYRELAKD